jgi:maleylacetoacetate isomerase
MKLYSYWRSSAAYRVRIALNVKGVDYTIIPKSFRLEEHRAGDYLHLNPQGLLPALETDDGAVLAQSVAIIEYLDEVYSQPELLPKPPLERAAVRSMALSIACDIHPLNNLRVLSYLRRRLSQSEEAVNEWYRHWIAEGFVSLEALAARSSTAKRYCYGDSLSMADICLAPQMANARRFQCDITGFPTLRAISSHLESLPAFVAAHPDKQPDAGAS